MQQSEVTTLRSRPQIVHPFLSDGHECKKSQCKGAGAFLPSTHTPEGAELIDSVLDVVRKEAEGEDLTPGLSFVDSPFLINQHRSLEPRKKKQTVSVAVLRLLQAATASRAFSSATPSVAELALAWALCSSPRRELTAKEQGAASHVLLCRCSRRDLSKSACRRSTVFMSTWASGLGP